MATEITKIDPSELVGRGVVGLPDAPEYSTLAMQEAFEDIVRNIVIPHINGMADEIDAAVDGAIETAHNEVQAIIDAATNATDFAAFKAAMATI